MALKPLEHNPLGNGGLPSGSPTQKIYITPEVSERKIKFKYKSVIKFGDPDSIFPDRADLVDPAATDLLNIYIERTCYVLIHLLPDDYDWYWRSRDAITTAVSRRNYYKQLRYLVGKSWMEDPGEEATCDTVRFGAILRNPTANPNDPFNMNVILDWGDEGVLPITIDPDLQNPKTRFP